MISDHTINMVGHQWNYREITLQKFVPLSNQGPIAVVASSRKIQTKVGTLACFDFMLKNELTM